MTQKESIKVWMDGSADAMDTAQKLFDNKKYNHSLFFLHLALEKIFKAIYIHKFDTASPYTHDLVVLAEKCQLDISDNQKKELAEISEFNVSARYEEYKYKIYKKATEEYTTKWFKIGLNFLNTIKKEIV